MSSWLVVPAAVSWWPLSGSVELWWALVACLVLFVVLVIANARAQQLDRRTRLRVSVNLLALVTVGLAVVVGVHAAKDDPDPGSCSPPDGIEDAAKAARERRASERDVLGRRLDTLENALDRARARDRGNGTAATAQRVGELSDRVSRTEERLAVWEPATVTVAEATLTTFDLGNDRNPGVRSIPFTLDKRTPGPALVAVTPTSFASATTRQEIAPEDLRTWAVLDPDGLSGTLYLCVSTHSRPDLPSGQLTGSLVADDVRLARFAPAVTLSLAYPDVARVMLVGLAIAFAASWYVFFLRRDQLDDVVLLGKAHTPPKPAGGRRPPTAEEVRQREVATRVLRWPFGFWWGYWRWATSASGVITIVAGMAAAVTAFSTAYLNSETWTGSFGDWFAYTGAVATAFVAGGTAGKLAQISAPGDEGRRSRRRSGRPGRKRRR